MNANKLAAILNTLDRYDLEHHIVGSRMDECKGGDWIRVCDLLIALNMREGGENKEWYEISPK